MEMAFLSERSLPDKTREALDISKPAPCAAAAHASFRFPIQLLAMLSRLRSEDQRHTCCLTGDARSVEWKGEEECERSGGKAHACTRETRIEGRNKNREIWRYRSLWKGENDAWKKTSLRSARSVPGVGTGAFGLGRYR
nr:hypothetical protein CFP56_04266 [Quercus suber]